MRFRAFNHLFLAYHYKVSKVLGISSKIPESNCHNLLFDVDNVEEKDFGRIMHYFVHHYNRNPFTWYRSNNGFHFIVFKPQTWRQTLKEMVGNPYVDLNWAALGIKRGYFFLQTRERVSAPEGHALTYMRVDRIA